MATFAANCLVDKLCADVNLLTLNPSSQNTYQLADICNLMDRLLSMVIVPLLKSTGQDYLVYNVDVPIVSGTTSYTFPARAVGNSVRDIVLLDSAGNEVALNNLQREYIKVQFPFNFVPSIWSFGQYTTGNEVNLYNTLIQTYTAYKLRFITERRPGGLTLSTTCGQISAITGTGPYVLTLSFVDPTWTTSTTFDIINNLPPFQSMQDNQAVTAVSSGSSQITIATLPTGVTTGMWVCPAMLSCIPQIQYEWFPLLSQLTSETIGAGLDMSQFVQACENTIKKFQSMGLIAISPRNHGSPRVIINKDNFGTRSLGRFGGIR